MSVMLDQKYVSQGGLGIGTLNRDYESYKFNSFLGSIAVHYLFKCQLDAGTPGLEMLTLLLCYL